MRGIEFLQTEIDLANVLLDFGETSNERAHQRCCLPEIAADSWDRTAGRNGDRSFDRQRGRLPEGSRVRGLDGPGAEAALDGRQGEALWD
jgi:hypothetical protein